MKAAPSLRTSTSLVLALAMSMVAWGPVPSAQEVSTGSMSGRVFSQDGMPIPSAKIRVLRIDTGEELASAPADKSGAYSLDGLPEGRYEVAVETPKGVYLVDRSLELSGTGKQSYTFRLKDMSPEEVKAMAPRTNEKKKDGVPADPSKAGQPTFWVNPLTVTLAGLAIVSVIYLGVDEARDRADVDVSPSGP